MDRLIKRFAAVRDGDLMISETRGVAYQKKMGLRRVSYDSAYLAKFDAYDRSIAAAVNQGRVAMLKRWADRGYGVQTVLDVGAGSGAFVHAAVAAGFGAKGYEVIPASAAALRAAGLFAESAEAFDAVTLWDVIEHLDEPESVLRSVRKGALLFASLPIFDDLTRIRESKHYRPGEHLTYWTAQGFTDWMAAYGFRLLEHSSHEIDAGREAIGAFAFCRDLPDYHDHIAAYQEIHATRHYGSSATELHLQTVASVVRRLNPTSILDYGCGRSDLVAHFWRDGARTIARYDPAIPQVKVMPEGRFDLVLACDVMEHIPMASVDRVLAEIKSKGDTVLFTISTKLARAKLPDGRNSHVTLLTHDEWTRWISDVFGSARALPSDWAHELILLAGEKQEKRCNCGGEMQLDSFDHPKRAREWFMRCSRCGDVGPSAPTERAARNAWMGEALAA